MIALDTNVMSELIRPAPSPKVVAWMGSLPGDNVYTTAICEAEILFGVALLPEGRRKAALARAVTALFSQVFMGRVLPFDRDAAAAFADLAAKRRVSGVVVGQMDTQIAAIALSRKVRLLATRNVSHFADCRIPVVNPWESG
jgi:predicted nucleic acid-binding protein